MKFSIKDFFSKWQQIRRKLRIWSHLLKRSLMENFIFCAVHTFVSVSYINNEAQLYERTNVAGQSLMFLSLSVLNKIRKSFACGKHRFDVTLIITFFSSLVDHIEEKTTYSLTNLRMPKYLFKRFLRTIEQTKITASDKKIQIDRKNLLDSTYKKIYGNIVKLELGSLNEKLFCRKCKAAVTPEDNLLICLSCNTILKQVKVASKVLLLKSRY